MTRPVILARPAFAASVALAALCAQPLHAQSMSYEPVDGESASPEKSGNRGGVSLRGAGGGARTTIKPYIEATQNVLGELSPGDDVLT